MRAVAADAGVNQALVFHFFGSKEQLFAATLTLPSIDVEGVLARVLDRVRREGAEAGAVEVTRFTFDMWEDPEAGDALRAMVRSSVSAGQSSQPLRVWLQSALLTRLAEEIGADRVATRVALVSAHLSGVALARYVVGVPALAELELPELVAWTAPAVHRYLTAPVTGAGITPTGR